MTALALLLLVACTGWTLLGLLATRRDVFPTTRRAPPSELPPVTILKPLCGADPGLEANLETFFRQDYPRLQLVFGVEDPHDPAVAIVRVLQARFPHVSSALVVHRGGRAINPKVRNLLGMLPAAQHDLLLISDSNVRVPPGYVQEMVETLHGGPRAGLVTSRIAGTGEASLGAALDAVQLNGFCAAGSALPTCFGDASVIGKSLLFSRRQFEALGGFAAIANVLAEDYVMGKLFEEAGLEVRLSRTVIENVTGALSVEAFLRRHLRWSMLRIRLRPGAFLLEPLTAPLALLPAALVGLGAWGAAWVGALLLLRDVGGWVALRGWRRAWVPALLAPARDLLMLWVWARTPAEREVSWRGNRVLVVEGTRLVPTAG
jgi:ceramide glucosyltransferase